MDESRTWRATLFDFDYTLADSSAGAVDCMRYALAELRLPDVDPVACARTMGLSLPATLAALAGEQHAHLAPEFVRLFMQRADIVMVPRTVVYPETPPLLAALGRLGCRRAIVSTKYRFRIEEVLARDGLAGLVEAIVGGEDVAAHKPAPDALHLALERVGAAADEALYVGDSLVDAQAAQSAGVAFVAVTSGHTPAEAFAPYAPLAVLGGVGELLGWMGDGADREQ
jgi:phosphoglycolate phosphatase